MFYFGNRWDKTLPLTPTSWSSTSSLAIGPLPLEEVGLPFSSLLMAPLSFEEDGKPAHPEDDEFLKDLSLGITTLWDVIASYSTPMNKKLRSGLSRIRVVRLVEADIHGEPSFAVLLSFDELASSSTSSSTSSLASSLASSSTSSLASSKCAMFREDISKLNASIHQLLNPGDATDEEPPDPPFKLTPIAPLDILTDPEPSRPPCTFCLEPLDATKSTFTTVCCHTFHVNCLRLWSQTNTCPVCRFDLLASDFSLPHPSPTSLQTPPSCSSAAASQTVVDHVTSTSSPTLTAANPPAPPPSPLRASPYRLNRATSQCQVCRKNRRNFASNADLKPASSPLPSPPPAALSSASSGLWICLICGDSNCGDMETPTHCNVVTPSTSASTSHAFDHYAGTLHAYALEVTSQKVFNFAEQGFVHRLVSAKGDGKIVQLAGGESSMEPSEWMDEEEEMLWNRKLEGLAAEYNEMLRHELEKTRIYYQEKILAIKSLYRNKEKEEASTSDYVDSLKAKEKVLRKRAKAATEKLEKGQKDLGFVTNLVESLQKNKTGNKEVIMAAENELEKVREMYNETIPQLEAKVNQLMLLLDGG